MAMSAGDMGAIDHAGKARSIVRSRLQQDRIAALNEKSVFCAIRAVLLDMIARRFGDIVVTSSVTGPSSDPRTIEPRTSPRSLTILGAAFYSRIFARWGRDTK
jgi:NAD(P)-dependent dehydrogenase (short-subunit alcohol dehydrogenase family)